MSIREDQNRFKTIIKGKVREDFKKYVTNGELIGRREGEFVKIPLPRIDIPTFRYGPKQDEHGVGQGDGESGEGPGQPGQGAGISRRGNDWAGRKFYGGDQPRAGVVRRAIGGDRATLDFGAGRRGSAPFG